MAHDQSVDAITYGFPSPTLPKQPGKASYRSIRDTHFLLAANAASIDSSSDRGQNGHLRIFLMTMKYALVSQVSFVRPADPGCTPNIPEWMTPFEEKALLREHSGHHRQYGKYRNVDAALHNQLITSFEDTYLSSLKTAFTGYSGATALTLLSHLYVHYARILATDLADNDKKIREAYNPN